MQLDKGTETILLIDDEEMVIEVGQGFLGALGYTVLLARTGTEGLDVYKQNRDDIAMVILDMILPDMEGGDVYERLRQINPEVKVLLSSGYSLNEQANKILASGCNGFIQKPFNIQQLSQILRTIIES